MLYGICQERLLAHGIPQMRHSGALARLHWGKRIEFIGFASQVPEIVAVISSGERFAGLSAPPFPGRTVVPDGAAVEARDFMA